MRSFIFMVALTFITLGLAACGASTTPTAAPAAPASVPATETTAPAAPATIPATAISPPVAPTAIRATATVPPASPTPVAPTPTPAAMTPTAASALRVTLSTNPAAPMIGSVQFLVDVTDTKAQPVNDATVKVTATHPGMNMSISGTATAQGKGRYAVQGNLSMGGAWKVKVEVNKTGLPPFAQEFDLEVMGM